MYIAVTDPGRIIKCAAWWPATAGQPVSNIDLRLLGPANATLASSSLITGVWEKVTSRASVGGLGTWALRITATALASSRQAVHAFCFY